MNESIFNKYSKKYLDHGKQSATDALKTTSKRAIQKTEEATGDLICNKVIDKFTKFSKTLQQNNSEIVKNISKERYIFPKEIQKIIDDLRLK